MGVGVNPPKTPVHEASNGIAAATTPNVCKMPGPPAPFVPTPLPNIGRSGEKPKDYSKSVVIEGNKIAIRGATFGSMGDIASKGTGGGLISSNTHGPTKFVGPGSMDVKVEGKNVQLLSDPMLNNCGPSGSPPNSATLAGVLQNPELIMFPEQKKPCSGGLAHQWECREAQEGVSLDRKIADAQKKTSRGGSFEGKAAAHNKAAGELKRGTQMSGKKKADQVLFVCKVCGIDREVDMIHDGDPPGSAPEVVEVKNKPKFEDKDLVQLARNMQTVGQGGASALTYKLPAGTRGSVISGQVNAASKLTGCPIRIIRI
jgi:hypothetical protein